MSIEVVTAADMKASAEKAVAPEVKADEQNESAPAPKEQGESVEESETSEGNDSDETHEGDESEADESESKDDDKPKKNKGIKKRFAKLTGKLAAKEQEADYWKSEALKLKSTEKSPSTNATPKVETKSSEGKPTADQFDTHEGYVEALTDWKIEQREKDKEAKTRQAAVKSELDKQVQTHFERVKEFQKSHSDFDEVIEDVSDVPMSIAVQEVILSSENGPELMYELAKNRDEYERICKLTPIAAARELGKFEAKIAKPSESKIEAKTTKAPTPITPVNTKSGSIKKSIFDEDLSQREYEELRAKQMAKRA